MLLDSLRNFMNKAVPNKEQYSMGSASDMRNIEFHLYWFICKKLNWYYNKYVMTFK